MTKWIDKLTEGKPRSIAILIRAAFVIVWAIAISLYGYATRQITVALGLVTTDTIPANAMMYYLGTAIVLGITILAATFLIALVRNVIHWIIEG